MMNDEIKNFQGLGEMIGANANIRSVGCGADFSPEHVAMTNYAAAEAAMSRGAAMGQAHSGPVR